MASKDDVALLLFDTGELAHVVDLLEGSLHLQRLGSKPYLHNGLREILGKAVDGYLRMQDGHGQHVDRANDLYIFVQDLATRIENSEMRDSDPDRLEQLWRYFISDAQVEYHHVLEKARRSKKASKSGKVGSDARWASKRELFAIYETLSKRKDYLGDPLRPDDLWPELYSKLEHVGYKPIDEGRAYKFGEERITFGAFRRQISRIRKQAD